MLTGSMETVPSSYEDSGVFLDHEDFGFIGEDEAAIPNVGDDFEQVIPHLDIPRTISRNGSFVSNNSSNNSSENPEDELASTGILILGPSHGAANLDTTARAVISSTTTIDNPSLSPRLSLPGTESLPTDLQSLHLESIHTTPSVNSSSSSWDDEPGDVVAPRLLNKRAVYWAYGILGSLMLILCLSVSSTAWLLAERRSWVQSNQKLEDQMQRMQSDWVHLATQWQRDQEASLATSRTIKASLQAQVEEQRRKIEEIYQEQREQKERKEQEKKEKQRQQRVQEETRRRKEQERRAAARKKVPPSTKPNFTKKTFSNNDSKTFDNYWTDTEEAILKWSDETHHKLRTMFKSLSKKVWKAKDGIFSQADRAFQQADRAFQQARTKIVKAWSDFYTAIHEPKEGWMEKAAPVVSTVFLATAAAALTEGTSRFVRYYLQEEDEE